MKITPYIHTAILLLALSCSKNNNEIESSSVWGENYRENIYKDDEINVWFDDTTEDAYRFYSNNKLFYYVHRVSGKTNGQSVYFYEKGGVSGIMTKKNNIKHGIEHFFYPSGNLERSRYYENDSLRGYIVNYYDKFNCKKSEEMAAPKSKKSYVFKRYYDSATQRVIEDHDHRIEWLNENPEIDPQSLKMPWEDENWFRK
jgi:antitoxin component YwqK of YwqJK toxin-antitoxin module